MVECASGTNRRTRWYRRAGRCRASPRRRCEQAPAFGAVGHREAARSSGPVRATVRACSPGTCTMPPMAASTSSEDPSRLVTDRLGRRVHDLRISVTDRCNFRCTYCMPKEVYGRDFAFLPQRPGPDLRGDRPARPIVRRRGRREAPDHRRRAARPAGPARPDRDAGRAAHAGRLARRPHPDDERLRPPGPRAGAPGGRAPAGHGQPRLARRGDVPGDERGRLPGRRASSTGSPPPARSGFEPIKVNMVVRRGINERLDRADGALGADGGPHPPVHRVHGRRPLERLAARRGRPGRRGDRDHLGGDAAGVAAAELPGRGRRPLALRRRQRQRSGSSPRSPRRSAGPAREPGSRPTGSSTPACSRRGAPTCARSSGAGPPTPSCGPRSGRSGRSAPTATPSCARPPRPTCPGSRCSRSAGSRPPGRPGTSLVHRPSTRPRNWWTHPGPCG